jgi:hypothetical protein
VYFTASYVQWSKSISDQRTLLVLNDAITRYKTEGGGTSSFTLGAPIGNILARLQSVITYGGHGHQVMLAGVTYPARSLLATGTGAQYQFYQYNSYKAQTLSSSTPNSNYPYGQGVGYAAVASAKTIAFVICANDGDFLFTLFYRNILDGIEN